MQKSSDFSKIMLAHSADIQAAADKLIAERDMVIKAANAILSARASKYVFKPVITQNDLDADLAHLLLNNGFKFRTGAGQRMHTLKFDDIVVNFSEINRCENNAHYKNRIEIYSPSTINHISIDTCVYRAKEYINRNPASCNYDVVLDLSDKYDFVISYERIANSCFSNKYLRIVDVETKKSIVEVGHLIEDYNPTCNICINIGDQKIKYVNDRMILSPR